MKTIRVWQFLDPTDINISKKYYCSQYPITALKHGIKESVCVCRLLQYGIKNQDYYEVKVKELWNANAGKILLQFAAWCAIRAINNSKSIDNDKDIKKAIRFIKHGFLKWLDSDVHNDNFGKEYRKLGGLLLFRDFVDTLFLTDNVIEAVISIIDFTLHYAWTNYIYTCRDPNIIFNLERQKEEVEPKIKKAEVEVLNRKLHRMLLDLNPNKKKKGMENANRNENFFR